VSAHDASGALVSGQAECKDVVAQRTFRFAQ